MERLLAFARGEPVDGVTPDHRIQLKAIDLVMSFTVAKPKTQLEITGVDGGPLEIAPARRLEGLSTGELRRVLAKLKGGASIQDALPAVAECETEADETDD